jgi:hypothetical protein
MLWAFVYRYNIDLRAMTTDARGSRAVTFYLTMRFIKP